MSNAKLKSLILENFQSIRERSTIPLGRLTFAYGPNSAGKSVVVDALQLARDFWSGQDCAERFRRWAHVIDGASTPLPLSLELKVQFDCDGTAEEGYVSVSRDYNDSGFNEIGQRFWPDTINDLLAGGWNHDASAYLGRDGGLARVSIDGENLWEFEAHPDGLRYGALNRYNLKHPILNGSPRTVQLLLDLAIARPTDGRAGFWRGEVDGWICAYGNMTVPVAPPFLNDEKDEVTDAILAIMSLHYMVLEPLRRAVGAPVALLRVSGERRIPDKEKMLFALDGLSISLNDDAVDIDTEGRPAALAASLLNSTVSSEIEPFRELAQSLCERKLFDLYESKLGHGLQWGPAAELGKSVNQMLREHLFLDNGYQFDVDIDHTLPISLAASEDEETRIHTLLSTRCFVHLFLRDGRGRRLSIDDVGSGIAYVAPVLVGLSEAKLCAVEQPELHLHPAMQAALGDVLLQQMNRGVVSYIETHSEHILLRVLRRMRQSAQPVDERLKVNAHQVVVLYFEPLDDGSTRVRHLRLTDRGDFMDRWPRGFFAERDVDLFDE